MAANAPPRRTKQQLKYTSPRCELEDDEVLPSQSLEDHDERWRHMMQQAGSHQQDGTVLDLTNRPTTPQALKVGVPPQVARRIQELHVNFHSSYSLPEWLDVVCLLFSQLQHLYTRAKYEDAEEVSKETARMRRLYILYRMPHLLSIDGTNVTLVERQLARPSSPNGYKVKREDWVSDEAIEDASSDDDSSVLQHHGDAVEVNLFGVVKRVSADPPKEEFDEPELVKPYEPKPVAEVKSVTKSVEQAHRSMQKGSRATKTASCGGLAAALVDSNPCVGSRRTTSLDEPHTVDYPSSPLTNDVSPPQTDKYAVPKDVRSDHHNKVRGSQANKHGNDFKSSKSKENNVKSPERTTEKRPTTPEQKKSPSTSLSSPFPMQFRSKSFNGPLPSRGTQLPRKMSSPDLSPEKQMMDSQSSKVPTKNRGTKQHSAQRPPPCPPGASRRVVIPEPRTRRRPWRSKQAIRSTSIVDDDDDDDDDDYLSEDEDVIEHE